jgi:AcrR family transcriptional regulator
MDAVNIKCGSFNVKKAGKARAARPYHHGDLRRSLIDAALALVTEKQDWTFSLREIARRAGVTHNAPYNHFGDGDDLLIALAAAGFERLRDHLRTAVSGIVAPDEALLACGRGYIQLALTNPALYRLMCGPALAKSTGGRPAEARRAANDARAVLEEIIHRGAQSGVFAVSPDDPLEQNKVVFFVWSVVHGLSMALIDGFTHAEITLDDLVREIDRAVLLGLRPRKSRR